MITTPEEILARPVCWFTRFASEALDILGSAFIGAFTAQDLANHPRWRQMQALLSDLELVDFMGRSLADLQRDEVLTPDQVSAICQGFMTQLTNGGSLMDEESDLGRLEKTERTLATLDEAERLLALLGDEQWYATAEMVIREWRDLAIPTPSLSEQSFVYKFPEDPDFPDMESELVEYWVRTWRGRFSLLGGRRYSILNIVESDRACSTELGFPDHAYPDISRLARQLRKAQGVPSLTLYVDRGMSLDWEKWPSEQWAKASVKTIDVEPLSHHELFALLSTSEFEEPLAPA